MKEKRIITDADGVLVNWIDTFMEWAVNEKKLKLLPEAERGYWVEAKFELEYEGQGHEYVHEFNRTERIRSLAPFRNSQKYVKQLANDGYEFHVITAIEDRPDIVERRTQNLRDLFGDVFHKVTCVGGTMNSGDKKPWLAEYKDTGCFWLEDSISHAVDGHDLGLETILLTHDYNVHFEHDDIHIVHDWDEVYDLIRG